MPFSIPAFYPWFPRKLQPWVYLLFICFFQLSSGRYLGALNEMIGEESLMREDLLMSLYCNMAGMALWFPMLFRMKFRFTNKTLLTVSALMVALCNLATLYVSRPLPLLFALCFVEGIFKIEGTFECFSTIQLWITPKRDFRVFFPVLHIFVLGAVYMGQWLTIQFAEYGHWHLMHWFIIGSMAFVLLVMQLTTRHFRFMPKFPLFGIDWTGWALWNALVIELAALLCYGSFLNWWKGSDTWVIAGLIAVTLAMALWRMFTVRHPIISPAIFRMKYVKAIFLLIVAVEIVMASEHVLEEIYLADVMRYGESTLANFQPYTWLGVIIGCAFALWWMYVKNFSYIRLIIVGLAAALGYMMLMYFTVSPAISIDCLYPAVLSRGFAAAVLSITFLISLHDSMTFETFFQGMGFFQALHLVVGGCLGSAIYTQGFSYYLSEGMARYGAWLDTVRFSAAPFHLGQFMSEFMPMVMTNAVKTLYGWVIFATIVLILAFLLYDSPIRRRAKLFPATWREVGLQMRKHF